MAQRLCSCLLLLAIACAAAACSGDVQTGIAAPSPLDVGPPALPLDEYLRLTAWPASPAAWRRAYTCEPFNLDDALRASTSRRHSACAYQLSERLCLADWEGADATWTRCCADASPTEGFCAEATRQLSMLSDVTELYRIYRENPKAVTSRYYYSGTTRDVHSDKLSREDAERVDGLHERFARREIDLMQSKHRTLMADNGLPLCIGQGHNWNWFCFHRWNLRGAPLIHFDSHADFAHNLDGYPFLLQSAGRAPDDPFFAEHAGLHVGIDEFIQAGLVDGSLHPTTTWVLPRWTRRYWPEHLYHASLRLTDAGFIASFSPDMDYDGVVYDADELDDWIGRCQQEGCSHAVDVTVRAVDHLGEVTLPDGPIAMSIDLDYFGTIDTAGRGDLPAGCLDPKKLQGAFDAFSRDLDRIPRRPALIAIAASPDFTCDLWRDQILGNVLDRLERRWPTGAPSP